MASWWECSSSRRTALRRAMTGTAALFAAGGSAGAVGARVGDRPIQMIDGAGTRAARAAIARLAEPLSRHIVIELIPLADGRDTFTIDTVDDRVKISGTTPAAIVSGFHHYLRVIAKGHLSRVGDQIPQNAPRYFGRIRKVSPHSYRYIYNFCVNGYTTPYWTWSEWERELDLIAAYGVNLALVTTGTEQLWIDTFTQFGYSGDEARKWISAFSVQPWQQMANLYAVGEPPTWQQLDKRVSLGQKIIARMVELGIDPVLPGYAGMVPPDFSRRNPGATVIKQGMWGSYPRPDWLATDTDLYSRVASVYYRSQQRRFGTHANQALDLLHEGGQQSSVSLHAAARGVESSLRKSFGEHYRWVIQGWGDNPRKEVLEAIDRAKVLVLDLRAERDAKWKDVQWRGNPFAGAPWTLGILANFGGRPGLYGDGEDLLHRVPATAASPKRGNLSGLAMMMEGIQNHALVHSLMSHLTWESTPGPFDEWLPAYVESRYGASDPAVLRAWLYLAHSAYGSWSGWPGGPDSLFNAAPSLDAERASAGAPNYLPYSNEKVGMALSHFLQAPSWIKNTDTYRYDVVDVARQVVVNHARTLIPKMSKAYRLKDLESFDVLYVQFFRSAQLLDKVLGTRSEFLLEPWLAQAERWGSTAEEKALMRSDAARLVTEWGDRPGAGHVSDYANRDWHGLLSTYYIPRWRRYLDSVRRNVTDNEPIPKFDWFAEGKSWFDNPPRTTGIPIGDPTKAAAEVAEVMRTW
ncbi:alpha-N-acetylglucosaminidase TIM-barrel domain-containing protein [Amycolatopsis sp. NPDC049868]|uniref:alpha-N-acetylglucosaminidase n=1 Tax=Amycolatopsis sp. NPDC049868 TaxID=3363934 RepID=UPI00379487F4